MTSPAGWYPDPDDSVRQRYFDGLSWTEHLAPLYVSPPQSIRLRLFGFSMAESAVAGAGGGAFCGALYGWALSAPIVILSEPSDGFGIAAGATLTVGAALYGATVGVVWGVSTGFVLSLALIWFFADAMLEGRSPNLWLIRLIAAASTTMTLFALVAHAKPDVWRWFAKPDRSGLGLPGYPTRDCGVIGCLALRPHRPEERRAADLSVCHLDGKSERD